MLGSDDIQVQAATALDAIFQRKKQAKKAYSLRAFARDLGIDVSTVSRGLSGKSEISKSTVEKALGLNGLEDSESDALKNLLKEFSQRDQLTFVQKPMTTEEYERVAGWKYHAVINLTACTEFRSDVAWIAQRLNLPTDEVEVIINALLEQGLVEAVDGELRRVSDKTHLQFNYTTAKIRQGYRELVEKGLDSMDRYGLDVRDHTATMVAINPEMVPMIREEVKKFRRSLDAKFERRDDKKEVYCFAVQVFPVTDLGESE
jgi:uncharacterized protein (TIGR02147 family)